MSKIRARVDEVEEWQEDDSHTVRYWIAVEKDGVPVRARYPVSVDLAAIDFMPEDEERTVRDAMERMVKAAVRSEALRRARVGPVPDLTVEAEIDDDEE